MRVVFAGTPEVAVPSSTRWPPPATSWSASSPGPTLPSGRGRKLVASPVAQRAEELGVPVLKPDHPRDPDFQDALRALWLRTAARWSPTARCCRSRPSTSRRTAGSTCTSRCCPPGAARPRSSTRSGPETRSAVPPPSGSSRSSTPGPTFGLMTETIRPRDTAGDLLGAAGRRRGPGSSSPPSTASRTAPSRPASSDREGLSFAPKITVDDARIDWTEHAVAIDRQVRACTAVPRRLEHPRR